MVDETWPDVASRGLGASVVAANDELFAAADNLISDGPPVHDRSAFGHRGKVYDGWETRRRRGEQRDGSPDWVIVRLGAPALVHSMVVDTTHFIGNSPTHAAIDATTLLGYPSAEEVTGATWTPLMPVSPLHGDTANTFTVQPADWLATHVRLRIYPDGGVARLRVHGEVVPDPRFLGGRIDLAAASNGGRITACSNMFYSAPAHVIAPGRARVMSDGWETARRRDDGNDWLTVALAAPGIVHHVVLDTSRFIGNAPGEARLSDAATGAELLPPTRLQPDTEHRFRVPEAAPVTQLRLDIYPDGGLSRLRAHGSVAPDAQAALAARWLGLLPPHVAGSVDPSSFFD